MRRWKALIIWLIVFLSLPEPLYAVRLKVATKAPETFGSAKIIKRMFDEIREKTGGKVRFKVYYGGIKGTGRDLLLKMRVGEVHGGEFTAGEVAPLAKDLLLMGIPFTFRDYGEVDFVFERMAEDLKEELERKGYIVLGWIEMGFVYLMSKEPIKGLSDLKSKRVWIPEGDRMSETYLRAMGVSPIPLPLQDVLIALETGQIDTVANSLLGAIALQWHTSVRYVTDLPLLYSYGLFMITKEAYERIPPKERTIMEEIMDKYFDELKRDMRRRDLEARKVLKKRGIRFIPVETREENRLRGITEEVTERIAGKEFSRKGLELLKGYLREYRGRDQR